MAVGERAPAAAVAELPDALDGATFLDRWSTTDDVVTTVDPDETYPVRRPRGSASRSTDGARRRWTRSDAVT